MAGYTAPKEFSFCQHVVMGDNGTGQQISTNVAGKPGETLGHGGAGINGAAGVTALLDPTADLVAMAESGNRHAGKWLEMFGKFQGEMAAGPENVDMSKEIEFANGRKTTLASIANFADLNMGTGQHFSSVPIRADGMAIGTLCVLDRKERTDVDLNKLQKIADRASKLLQKKRLGSLAASAVVKITAADAAEHLRSPQQRVAVMLHTANCRGCHELLPHWEELAKTQVGNIKFATFNLDGGDVPLSDEAWKVKMVPSIVLVPRRGEQQTEPRRYPGTPAPATIGHITQWLSADASTASTSTAVVDLGPVRGAPGDVGRDGKALEISDEQARQIQLLCQVIDNENLSEETRRIAREKMEAHTAFQIMIGERSTRLSQLAAESALEDQFRELAGSLMPVRSTGDEALATAIAARVEFREWLGEQRLLRHEAIFAHVLGRDLSVQDLLLLEPEDVAELGWEMTRVERRRFEAAVKELKTS